MEKNIVVPPRIVKDKDSAFEGAFVKEPKPGMYKWVSSFDLNSLYPHLMMQYNISPETLIEPENYTNEIRKINSPPDWKVLYKHPYVGPTHAKLLHPFFSIHPYLKRKEWDAMQGLTQEFKDKIAPYLLFID